MNGYMDRFLEESEYVDYSAPPVESEVKRLFIKNSSDIEKTKTAYEFVRDCISHSFDKEPTVITVKASDVLRYRTGICHAKANLLAALLRSQGIPTGFCFQYLTLADDDSLGYCVHCYNAVHIEDRWIKLDARGNTGKKNAQFSMDGPILAFFNRKEYGEFFWPGIYARPHMETMRVLENARSIQDIIDNMPDDVPERPDIYE